MPESADRARPGKGAAPGPRRAAPRSPRCPDCGSGDFTSSFAYVGVAGSGYLVHCAACGRAVGFVPALITRLEQEIMERIERETMGDQA